MSGRKVVSGAGGVLLTRTATAVGLDEALSGALAPWRRPLARHDPGKIVLDLAISLAIGGDCLADIGQLRAHPEVFGAVASDPTVSRCIDSLAADSVAALEAISAARATARARAWAVAGQRAPDQKKIRTRQAHRPAVDRPRSFRDDKTIDRPSTVAGQGGSGRRRSRPDCLPARRRVGSGQTVWPWAIPELEAAAWP